MKRLNWIVIISASIALTSVLRAEDGPTQAWLTTSTSYRLDHGLEAVLETENRFFDEGPAWGIYVVSPVLVWHQSSRYDFQLGYQYSGVQARGGHLSEGHEVILGNIVHAPFDSFHLSCRQQLRCGEASADSVTLLRQRLRLDYTGDFFPFKIKPFLDDEWFFDFEHGDVSENRLRGGLGYKINEYLKVYVYGMRQDRWKPGGKHVVSPVGGMFLQVSF